MENVINLEEYRYYKNLTRPIKVEDVKKEIETARIGNFFGKTDNEIEKYYKDLTNALNDMIENPCGTTSYALRKFSC